MKILVVYYMSKDINNIKYNNWCDGFTESLNILKKKYNITLLNVNDNKYINYNNYNIVILKEGFNGFIYRNSFLTYIKNNKKKVILCLAISSSKKTPSDQELKKYDILFYETKWYYKHARLNRHQHSYHAFGVNKNIMKPINCEKIYDVIFVGSIIDYKRPLNILNCNGKKIAIGYTSNTELVNTLKKTVCK